ncbi:hypothetical protein [Flavobacterium sp. W21_SRS_FM6]|uniref:hypothetical protein n=1 Tax=Flavobacterium sp. W21_SRS_FM6 TaxID=3240268 RepID=UPI003F91F0EB
MERAFDTFQTGLAPELRLNNINDIASAKAYLPHGFIRQFWQSHIQVISKHQVTELRQWQHTASLMTSV